MAKGKRAGRYSELLEPDRRQCEACRGARAVVFVNLETVALWVYLCGRCVRSLAARYSDAVRLLGVRRAKVGRDAR